MAAKAVEIPADRALTAIAVLLAAQVDQGAEQTGARGSVSLLDAAGFKAGEIAALTGRDPEAVRSSLRRSRKA